MDRKQIIDALKTLQTCCESHERCTECPLYNDRRRECGVGVAAPSVWRINEPDVTIWRGLN